MIVNQISPIISLGNNKSMNCPVPKKVEYKQNNQLSNGMPNLSLNYFVSFGQKQYSPQNDRQLQNIRQEYNLGDIRFQKNISPKEKYLIECFFNGKYDENLKRILGSNGTTYIVSDGNDKVVIKCQHKKADGTYETMKTKCDSLDFDMEADSLLRVPVDYIHSTKLLAKIETSSPDDMNLTRKMLAIRFINGEKLTDSKIDERDFLTKDILRAFYKDLLALDQSGFYHRDLNAYNILASDKDNALYIIDYGSGKDFATMQKKADEAKTLFEKKLNRPFYWVTTIDTLAEDSKLLSNIKYRKFDDIEYSNLENFESLALLPYLKVHLDKMKAKVKVTEASENIEKQKGNKIDKLFLEHLVLASEYHQNKVDILNEQLSRISKNNEVAYTRKLRQIQNEKILANALKLVKPDNPDDITKDIGEIELLKLKMLHSQKAARLYVGNDDKNYKMALYWNMELGTISKYAQNKISSLEEKYNLTDNQDIIKYLDLNKKIAAFYNQQIFPEVYISVSNAALKAVTTPSNAELFSIAGAVHDGCWLDSSKRAPSNYVPDTPHKYGIFQF